MNPEISIVVPVYNVEDYLVGCVDSILSQSFSNWELLLVDDGSPDRSGQIADACAKRDPRVQVLHQSNGGLDAARKNALPLLEGEFVVFLDSDDRLVPDALSHIHLALSSDKQAVDIFQMYFLVEYPDDHGELRNDFASVFGTNPVISGERFLEQHCLHGGTFWNVWSKVYRRSFLQRAHLKVHSRYACEDLEMLLDCVLAGARYGQIAAPLVRFRSERPDSITTHMSNAYLIGYFASMDSIVQKLIASQLTQKEALAQTFAVLFLQKCLYCTTCDTVAPEVTDAIQRYRPLLKMACTDNATERRFRACCLMLGARNTYRLFHLSKSIRATLEKLRQSHLESHNEKTI